MLKHINNEKNISFWILIGVLFFFLLLRGFQPFVKTYSSARSLPQPHQLTEEEKLISAQNVLIKYFAELHDGNYVQAAGHYSGSYIFLELMNPEEPAINHNALLEDACEINGFYCLEIMEIVSAEKVSSQQYRFEVTFQEDDGTLHQHQTNDGTVVSVFPFTVVEKNGQFLVEQLPLNP